MSLFMNCWLFCYYICFPEDDEDDYATVKDSGDVGGEGETPVEI
jgi:hypothetical protein